MKSKRLPDAQVIINHLLEAEVLSREAIASAVKATLKDYIDSGNVKCAYDVGSGACEDFAYDVIAKLTPDGRETPDLNVIEYANLTGRAGEDADEIFYPEMLKSIGLSHIPVPIEILNKSGLGEVGTHVFVRWKSPTGYLYFDAEVPEGVDSPFDLPFAQRYLNTALLHNWK